MGCSCGKYDNVYITLQNRCGKINHFCGLMEHPLDKTLHLDMVPRTSKTLYVKDEFVISDNLSIRVPPGIAALLEKGRPTRTLRPNWLEFPYRIGFNAILFVETGVVDCILNTETFRITNRSVLLIPSATLLRDLSWQAGTRYILFGYNDGKLFSALYFYNLFLFQY